VVLQSRIDRIAERIKLGDRFIAPVKFPRSHAFNESTKEFLRNHMIKLELLDDGFPCPHRRMTHYFIEESISYISFA
jgi:hypothetical protein